MDFEPFNMASYSRSPSNIHSIWGEFRPLAGARDFDPQLAAMENTLEALRQRFGSSFLFLEGDSSPLLDGLPRMSFPSRYVLDQHNGKLLEYGPLSVQLIDVTKAVRPRYSSLLSLETEGHTGHIGIAALYSRNPLRIDPIKDAFIGANSLESLRTRLHSILAAFLGFDHDAFFTFESRDVDLVEEALRSARIPRPRGSVA